MASEAFKKNCRTCENAIDTITCDCHRNNYRDWQPSELYTAYLAAEARANGAEVNLLLARDK